LIGSIEIMKLSTPIFCTVLFLTTLSGGSAVYLSSQPNQAETQKQVLVACITTWQTGIGAIFGLLSKSDDNDEDQ
jgi:hypothetical protein